MAMSVEKKVGIFFLLTLIALGGLIELVEDWQPFEDKYHYKAYFESVVGINEGDPVRMAGVQLGKVTGITLKDNKVRIDFYINRKGQITKDTVAVVSRTNLLGGLFLGLNFGEPGSEPIPPGSEVKTREMASIDEVIDSFNRNQERVLGGLGDMVEANKENIENIVGNFESVSRKIDEGEGVLGKLVNDPRLYEDLQQATASLERLAGRLERGEGTLGKLFADDSLYDDAAATMSNLRTISDDVRAGEGTVGRLFNDDRLYDDAADALAGIRDITAKANRGEGTLGKLVNDDSLYLEVEGFMTSARSIAEKIDRGEGSLGKIVNDDSLYRDARTTLNKVEKAAEGLSDSGPISALGTVVGTLF